MGIRVYCVGGKFSMNSLFRKLCERLFSVRFGSQFFEV